MKISGVVNLIGFYKLSKKGGLAFQFLYPKFRCEYGELYIQFESVFRYANTYQEIGVGIAFLGFGFGISYERHKMP